MKKQTKKSSKVLLIIALLVILGVAVGYATLSQKLTIEGTANIASDWKVLFTSITLTDSDGATDATDTPKLESTTKAVFDVTLDKPGSYAEYSIVVENQGTIDAKLKSITDLTDINAAAPTDIKFTITGDAVGTKLAVDGSTTYTVRVEWLATSEEIPTEKSKTATIELEYEQAE